jgi:outer membrane biosynthesis protein TonB
MSEHFIQIQCPSCASTEVELISPQTYRCRHCSSTFLYRDPRPPAPPPVPPPQPSVATNHWGPAPQVQPTHVYVATHGSSAGRWIAWVVVMLVVFGGSGVSAFVAWFNGSRAATSTSPTPSTTASTPQAPKPTPLVAAPAQVPTVAAAETPKPAEAQAEPEPDVKADAVDLKEYQSLSGCGCRTDVDGDGRKDQLDLYLRAGSSAVISSQGTDHFVDLSFAVAGEGVEPFALPTTEETAPATRYHAGRFGLGVGCEGDTMVIAALGAVSGWSIAKHELRWTRPLEPAFSRFAEGKAAVDCKPISVSAGVARVHTEGGSKSLRVDTGDEADRTSTRPSSSASSSSKPSPPKPEPKPEPAPAPKAEDAKPKPEPRPRAKPKPSPPPVPPPEPAGGGKKRKKKGKKAEKDP